VPLKEKKGTLTQGLLLRGEIGKRYEREPPMKRNREVEVTSLRLDARREKEVLGALNLVTFPDESEREQTEGGKRVLNKGGGGTKDAWDALLERGGPDDTGRVTLLGNGDRGLGSGGR